MDVNKKMKFLVKIQNRGPGVGLGGQGRCVQRIEIFLKINKKSRGVGGIGLGGGPGGCERRIEVIVKMQKRVVRPGMGGARG